MDKCAVGWNGGAGYGVDWFAVDEMVGDFPSPGVHPVRVDSRVCRTTPNRMRYVRKFTAKRNDGALSGVPDPATEDADKTAIHHPHVSSIEPRTDESFSFSRPNA